MFYALAILFYLPCLFSQSKTVELVANYYVDASQFTGFLAKKNLDIVVERSDLSHYGIGKTPSAWEKFLHKFSLDFWKAIPLKKDVQKILFFNLTNKHLRDFKLGYLPKEKLVLFMWEPPVVLHKMYKAHAMRFFSRAYTWDDDLVDGVTFFKLYYPCLQPMAANLPSFEEKKLCTLVNSRLKSKRKGCLYQEREKAIAFFEKQDASFEFYGKNWDTASYKSYRGTVVDKIAVMKNYRFSICYENSSDRNGYVTEKIFDSFAAGCVPIYWGAPNIEKYVPKECFIDRRHFADMEELYHFLTHMDKQQYEQYLNHIRAFLNSLEAQVFSFSRFEQTICEAINN